MRCRVIIVPLFLAIIMVTAIVSGCSGHNAPWSVTINGNASTSINGPLYERFVNDSQTEGSVTGIPLEIFLYHYAIYPVTSVSYGGVSYDWNVVAQSSNDDTPMLVTQNGSLYYDGKMADADDIEVSVAEKPNISTLDVEPSVLYALDAGVARPGILPEKTDHVVLIYIDAFGYQRYEDSARLGLVNNISALGEPLKAHAVYPSVTQPNAKAMATGVDTDLVRGDFRSYIPYNDTMLDILDREGRTAVWVDGDTAPVFVNGTVLNKDQNGDGSDDDEAADAAIAQYKKGASLVVVHFVDTDEIMHKYGPGSPQAEAAVKRTDELAGKIVASLDKGTAVVVWADHGCHESEGTGDHGMLIPDDMDIPIFVHYV